MLARARDAEDGEERGSGKRWGSRHHLPGEVMLLLFCPTLEQVGKSLSLRMSGDCPRSIKLLASPIWADC